MRERIFYWMKFYLGFSGKESRGFLVLVPFLALLGFSSTAVRFFKNQKAEHLYEAYRQRLDSLDRLSIQLVTSPLPTFNPQDTVKISRNQKQLENLNRIMLSEADSITLQIVPGIGPGTASRIIKYRQHLGGFHTQNQLLEVFGFSDELIETMLEYFEFDSNVFRKIPVNSATQEQLSSHPYISYGEAKVLVAFRKQHGRFDAAEDLLAVKIFKEDWIQKIKPYLAFD